MGRRKNMKAVMLITGGGPVVILTSHNSVTAPAMLEKLKAKGIDRFFAYELPLDAAKTRYGSHFQMILNDLHETDDFRVLDCNGEHVFALFRLDELGIPFIYDSRSLVT